MSVSIDMKAWGPEPEPFVQLFPVNSYMYGKAFNWYSYFYNPEKARKWLVEYATTLKYSPEELKLIERRCTSRLVPTTFAIARMLNRGSVLPDKFITNIKGKLDGLLVSQEVLDETQPTEAKPAINPQDRIKRKKAAVIACIEHELDHFLHNKFQSKFNPYEYFKKEEVSAVIASAVAEYYGRLQDELKSVNSDPQLKEAYRKVNKDQLAAYLKFVTLIIDDSNRHAGNLKKAVVMKQRAPREKSSEQIVKEVKYLKEFGELKLMSVNPASIVGAAALWTYHVKDRVLTHYVGASGGLNVKGTTLYNFDEKLSVRKTLRKPEDVMGEVLNGGKVTLRELMGKLTTKAIELNGRLNENTILLRVVK